MIVEIDRIPSQRVIALRFMRDEPDSEGGYCGSITAGGRVEWTARGLFDVVEPTLALTIDQFDDLAKAVASFCQVDSADYGRVLGLLSDVKGLKERLAALEAQARVEIIDGA